MFRLGRRDERAVEAVREEMNAADTRARMVLADAMAHIESRISTDHEETARLQASTQAAIENLRHEVVSRPADIGPVLEQVAAMCALVAEKIEADRLERRALTEAIALLARSQPALSEERSRVLGGTVLASADISLADDWGDREPPEAELVDVEPVALGTIDIEPIDIEPVDLQPVDLQPVDLQPVDLQPVDLQPVETRPVAPATLDLEAVDAPVDRPVVAAAAIDLVAEEAFEPTEPAPPTEVWDTFEERHFGASREDDTSKAPPRQGTRLTASRRSNAGAAWR